MSTDLKLAALGWLRMLVPGRNPLARCWDRTEARCRVAVLILLLLAGPGALAVGVLAAQETGRRIDTQRETAAQVQATLLEDSIGGAGDPAGRVVVPSMADAQWTDGAGAQHSGVVEVPYQGRPGDLVTIWIDGSGDPIDAPPSRDIADVIGVLAGLGAFGAAVLVVVGAFALIRRRLDRCRLAEWEAGWRAIEPRWRRRYDLS